MTKKDQERELVTLKTAEILEEGMKTEFWEHLKSYFLVRIASLKNELAKIDLVKELSKASKIQGEIKAFYSVFNRINNVMKEADIIRKKEKRKEK